MKQQLHHLSLRRYRFLKSLQFAQNAVINCLIQGQRSLTVTEDDSKVRNENLLFEKVRQRVHSCLLPASLAPSSAWQRSACRS